MDSVALFLCIVRYFVGEEILLESASFVYSFIVVIKQKTRPGSLFYGKRGGFCCCKYREYILNYKTFFKKNFAHISSSIQNDTLFAIKRYVIFSKTSRRFQQNDTLFSLKRHVVFWVVCASKIQTSPCVKSTRNRSDNFDARRWKWTFSKTKKGRQPEAKERQKPYKRENNYVLTTKLLFSKNLALCFYN